MADASFTQSSFFGGEWSRLAQGRIDDPRYRTAMNVCLNAVISETGAWVRRGGTQYIATTKDGGPARVLRFDFEANAPYNMEFSDNVLRFIAGSKLATTNDDRTVSSISINNPAVVTTDADHGWSSGDQIYVVDGDSLISNRVLEITVTDTDKFTIADAISGGSINGLAMTNRTTGTISRIQQLGTNYGGGLWTQIRSVQAETSATLLHPTVAPYIVTVATEPETDTFAEFAIDKLKMLDGPYLDPVEGGATVTPDGKVGVITLTIEFAAYDATVAYSIGDFVTSSGVNYQSLVDSNVNHTPASNPTKWQTVDSGIAVGPDGFTGADVGRHIRLFSEPAAWLTGSVYNQGDTVKYADTYWSSRTNSNSGNKPGRDSLSSPNWAVDPTAAIWTWGKITGLASTIDRSIAGSVPIGSLTGGGGLAAAFDGVTLQDTADSARDLTTFNAADLLANPKQTIGNNVGQNYTSSTPNAQTISSATIYPSSDGGLCWLGATLGLAQYVSITRIIVNLRGSQTAPASSADGTLLGQKVMSNSPGSAFSVRSTDKTTAWKYVWIEILCHIRAALPSGTDSSAVVRVNTAVAEMQLFSPDSDGSASAITAQIIGPKLLYTTPISVWRLGAFSNSLGWPSCGTYHEGRIWLGGAIGNRFDASRPGDVTGGELDFAPTEPDGTVTDSNGITYVLDAADVNPIFWMEPDQQGIICGTKAGEWLVQASALNNPLTPLNIQAHRVTRIGCANIEPRRTEHTLVFVQKFARKVMEYFADVFSGKFTAPNLHEKAKHLTLNGIAEIAYQQELVPIIWARGEDGSLIGGSYKRDTLMTSQGPTFMGWHPHTLGSSRSIESICVGSNSDGTLDALTMVTADPATGVRHLEVMTNIPDESTTLQNGWFLDSGIVPNTSTVTVSGTPHFRLGGLLPHEGKTVSVFAGGYDLGDYVVSQGQVDVPFAADADRQFTQAYVAAYEDMPVLVGFSYTSDGQIVRPASQQDGGVGLIVGRKRKDSHYTVLLDTTKGLSVGTDFTKLRPALFKTSPDGGSALTALETKSGIHWQELNDTHGFDNALCWRISRPYPAAVAAVTTTKEQ